MHILRPLAQVVVNQMEWPAIKEENQTDTLLGSFEYFRYSFKEFIEAHYFSGSANYRS